MGSSGGSANSAVDMAPQEKVEVAALLIHNGSMRFFVDAENSVQKIVLKNGVAG